MRRYFNYTDEEILALDDTGIRRLIDIEVANAGIAPIPMPEKPELVDETLAKTDRAYEVGGVYVKTEEEAMKLASMDLHTTEYDYNTGGYDYKFLKPIATTIEKRDFYRQQDIVLMAEVIRDNKRRQEDYNEVKAEYDKYLKETGKHYDAVWEHVKEVRERAGKIEAARRTFNYYLDLAEGDEQVAVKFFKNTYGEYEDVIAAVVGNDVLAASVVADKMLEDRDGDDGADKASS